MSRNLAFILPALAALIALAPLALAQEEGEGKGLSITMPDPNESEVLKKAALVQPVPARTLKRMLPQSFAGLPQTSADGKVHWMGPAGMTRVEALYGAAEGGVKVLVIDPAGMPRYGSEYIPPVPVGETLEVPRGERRGVRIGDFDATVEVLVEGAFARVQAYVGPRLHVSAESYNGVSADELVAALGDVDLGAFAAMAPGAAPAPGQ